MSPPARTDVQDAVDRLAEAIRLPVLVEDPRHGPLWWSRQTEMDDTRARTILRRGLQPAAEALVARLGLAQAEGPVHTPAVPEADMASRWCLPLRSDGELLGYLWVSDPASHVGAEELARMQSCAAVAASALAVSADDRPARDRRRATLLGRLAESPDHDAARELIALEALPHDVHVGVDDRDADDAWTLPGGWSVRLDPTEPVTSGPPVRLAQLSTARRRAEQTRQAVSAGARIDPPTWDRLGSWLLVVTAPDELRPDDVHPGVQALRSLPRADLLDTARVVLERGGDIVASAEELHLHRTTLYYRLERIEALTGVDLKAGAARVDLQFAIRLGDYRAAGMSSTDG